MKKLILFSMIVFGWINSSFSQPEPYLVLGYGFEFNSWSKAYSHWNSANSSISAQPTFTTIDGITQYDYTGVNFQKDKFNSTNWVFKMGYLGDGFYFESDMSYIFQELGAVFYEYVANKDLRPKLHYGIGSLRKIEQNTGIDSASGYGYAANLWNMEFGFGGGNFKVGPYTGFSALDVDYFRNVSSPYATNSATYKLNDPGLVFGSLGLGFHYSFENQALLSLRFNRIRTRSTKGVFSNKDYEPWRGLEIYPSLKLFAGDDAGFYLEIFGKYYMFSDYESPEYKLPEFNFNMFGISLGFYVPYY